MLMIVSEKTGKHLLENRYPNKGPKGIKIKYSFERDPKATFSDYVKITGHAEAAEFAKKISKRLNEKCQSIIVALNI